MRYCLSLVLACLASSALANDSTRTWDFTVLLDDKRIGSHRFDLKSSGSNAVLESVAKFDVSILFVPVFSYRHQNVETWTDGCLTAIDASTDNNGQLLQVNGTATQDGFSVTNATGEVALDGCVKTFAYWNPAILDSSSLLNAQTGEYEPVSVSREGEEFLTIGNRSVPTERYRLNAQSGEIVLWYTKGDRQWVGLSAPTKSDRRLRYLATSVPEPDMAATMTARVAAEESGRRMAAE